MKSIVFFEDEGSFALSTAKHLQKRLGKRGKVKLFEAESLRGDTKRSTRSYLERIETLFRKGPYGDAAMIVTDTNLAELDGFKGLSAEVIIELGRRLCIPVCVYSVRAPNELEELGKWIDGRIKLKYQPNDKKMFDEIASVYSGFTALSRLIGKLKDLSRPLPETSARILGRPQYADRFVSYAVGNQAFYGLANLESKRRYRKGYIDPKALVYMVGTWLITSIFKFPGILVNETAAASYLDIDPTDFAKPDVQKLFRKAKFDGPFSDGGTFWWRDELDEILTKGNTVSGFELASKKLKRKIQHCFCSVDSKSTAGFFCIITEKPVSRSNSNGELAWIPRGADLSRVSNKVLDQISPWFGTLSDSRDR